MTKPILDENDPCKLYFDFYSSEYYKNYILTEAFIEKYQNILDWMYVSAYQELSESFIEKFQNRVNWFDISSNQKLSNFFIAKHKDKLFLPYLKKNKNVDQLFIEKLELLQS